MSFLPKQEEFTKRITTKGIDEVPFCKDDGDQQDYKRAMAADIQGTGYRHNRNPV